MKIIETLTMAEVEELITLTGKGFTDLMSEGVQPGRPMACLAWLLAKRTDKTATIDAFMSMTMAGMVDYLKGFEQDPKETSSSS